MQNPGGATKAGRRRGNRHVTGRSDTRALQVVLRVRETIGHGYVDELCARRGGVRRDQRNGQITTRDSYSDTAMLGAAECGRVGPALQSAADRVFRGVYRHRWR